MTDAEIDNPLVHQKWKVEREGFIIPRKTGNRIRYQLLVRDVGRVKFFINMWFGTVDEALDYMSRLQMEVQSEETTP